MKKNIRVIWLLFKLKLSRSMVYRFNFFNGFFIDGIGFGIQMLMFQTIYGNVDRIGDWGRAEALLFTGTIWLINALNMLIYFFGVNGMSEKILTGEMDLYLSKPFSALVRLSLENIDLGSLPLVALNVGVVIHGIGGLPGPVAPGMALGYVLLVLLMTLLWYDMEVIIRSLNFFVIKSTAIVELEGSLLEMNMRVPGILYKGILRPIFLGVLPYGLMGTVPVQFIIGAMTPAGIAYSVCIVALFTYLAIALFHLGVKNYKSASS